MTNIPIRVPQRLVNMWIAFGDWANVWVWRSDSGTLRVLRIDILMVIAGMFICGFYWALYNWRSALGVGIAYAVVTALALFMRRPSNI